MDRIGFYMRRLFTWKTRPFLTPQLIGTERYNVEDGDDDQAKGIG